MDGAQVITRHRAEVTAWLGRLLRDDADVDDAWSAASERILTGFATYRGDSDRSPRAWVFQIARNEAHRLLQRRARISQREVALRTRDASVLGGEGPGPSTQLRESDRIHRLREGVAAILEQLEDEDGALLVLRFQEGLQHPEIAERLSTPDAPVTPAAVRKRLSRLTQRLREHARASGLEDLSTP
ncbi:MAG: sigma-70 family RNA polymerase sigma factor [Deltaproteobacteria bacterium]